MKKLCNPQDLFNICITLLQILQDFIFKSIHYINCYSSSRYFFPMTSPSSGNHACLINHCRLRHFLLKPFIFLFLPSIFTLSLHSCLVTDEGGLFLSEESPWTVSCDHTENPSYEYTHTSSQSYIQPAGAWLHAPLLAVFQSSIFLQQKGE